MIRESYQLCKGYDIDPQIVLVILNQNKNKNKNTGKEITIFANRTSLCMYPTTKLKNKKTKCVSV